MKKLIGIIVVVAIVATLVVVRAKRVRQMENEPLLAQLPVPVEVAPAIETNVVNSRYVLGVVRGADEAGVAPQVMARMLTVSMREGDAVKAGQLLAQLDPREFQDSVTAAEASLAAAQTARAAQQAITQRDRRLLEVKAIAQEQWDQSQAADAAATAQLETARQRLNQARTQLSYCHIVAPMDGVVARRLADPGDLAVPGKPLFQFVRQDAVRVRANLPPEDFPELHIGQPVTLTWKNQSLHSAIARVFPAMSDSLLATIEVDLPQPPAGFVSGATVGVDVQMSSAQGLAVPLNALLEGERGAWVFVVRGDAVHPVQVSVRDRSATEAVVQGSVCAGDHVIVARPSRLMALAEGMKVAEANQP